MNGYSKIKSISEEGTRSEDAEDRGSTDPESLNRDIKNEGETEQDPPPAAAEKPDGGLRLSRNRSVSSAVQTTLKKSRFVPMILMRRSASVTSERYCRIHDQNAVTSYELSFEEEDDREAAEPAEEKKKKRRTRILKVCKRLLGM